MRAMNAICTLRTSGIALSLVLASLSGCSDDTAAPSSSSGGTKATGGGSTGGASGTTGGKATGGGSTGGASSSGGNASSGGSSTGGANTGGTSTGGGSSSGGASATGGAGTGSGLAIGTGACTLQGAPASAAGKTCAEFCTAWLDPASSCHDIEGFITTYPDNTDMCKAQCGLLTEAQFCCRMEHVALSLDELAIAVQANADNPNLTQVALHCGHANGMSICP